MTGANVPWLAIWVKARLKHRSLFGINHVDNASFGEDAAKSLKANLVHLQLPDVDLPPFALIFEACISLPFSAGAAELDDVALPTAASCFGGLNNV